MDYTQLKNKFKQQYRPPRYHRRRRPPWYLRIKTLIVLMVLLLILFYAPSVLWGSLRLLLKARDAAITAKRFISGDHHPLGNIARIANIVVAIMVVSYLAQKIFKNRRK